MSQQPKTTREHARLAEIRSTLDQTRAYYQKHNGAKDSPKNLLR